MKNSVFAAAVAATLITTSAYGDTLSFASTNPEMHPMNIGWFSVWAEEVNKSGALTINLRHGPTMANHTNFYDRVIDGVVDGAWGMTVFNPGKFTNSLVMGLPFYVKSAEQGSVVACRLWEAGLLGNDYADLRPLFFAQFPQSSFHTIDKPIEGLPSMEGLNVIALAPVSAKIAKGNGGKPLSVNLTEVYEALERGMADALLSPFTVMPAYRFDEHLKHHYVAPLGGALGVAFLSNDSYEALSDEAKAVIDPVCETSRRAGQFIDQWETSIIETMRNKDGHTVTVMPPQAVQGVIGYVGEEILANFADAFPGGQPLVDGLLKELEAAKPN